jgi:geranylgeranyl pyrophosphate synthase
MDDDDLRRGRPTVHVVYGSNTAMVAGVAMVPLAVAAVHDGAEALSLSPEASAGLVSVLMRASGAGGMVGGQLMDLEGEGRTISLDELESIHLGKTASLIAAAALIGARAAGAAGDLCGAVERFGAAVGLAFQIMDDVLDVTGTTAVLGKPAGSDVELAKTTYVSQLGVGAARERAVALVTTACADLRSAGVASSAMEALAQSVLHRST